MSYTCALCNKLVDDAHVHDVATERLQIINPSICPSAPPFMIGDVVKFVVGGFGIIVEESRHEYATQKIPGLSDHPHGKRAWHDENEMIFVEGSAIRKLVT